jgi:hypothetical protein
MNLFVIILFLLAVLPVELNGQVNFVRNYGGDGFDRGHSVQQTFEGGYVIAGYTSSFGAGDHDIYLVKTDSLGEMIWTNTFGGSGYESGHSVQQTYPDSGYIIAGSTDSFGAGSLDIYLIKTDANGDTIWTKTFGGDQEDAGFSVQQTFDGGYIVAGYIDFWNAEAPGIYIIKTTSDGDTLWTKRYGGPGIEYSTEIKQTLPDSGFIIVGQTIVSDSGYYDIYLIKTDSSGDTLWTKMIGGALNDKGESIKQTPDKGYIITGQTESFGAGWWDVYLIKTNSVGDTLWTRTYGGTGDDGGNFVHVTNEGAYIVTGSTHSFGEGLYNIYLIKTDVSGNTIWDQVLSPDYFSVGHCVRQTSDGGYIITGASHSSGQISDVILVKTKPDGTVAISPETPSIPGTPKSFTLYQNYPNPFNPVTTISFDVLCAENDKESISVHIYDICGRHVRTLIDRELSTGNYKLIWDGKDEIGQRVASGIYFYKLRNQDSVKVKKMILQK